MLLLITPNIFNKITLKKNYLAQCAGLRLVPYKLQGNYDESKPSSTKIINIPKLLHFLPLNLFVL